MKLEDEIKQKEFKDVFLKADVNLVFTAAWQKAKMHQLLKPFDISIQQYNILRILKGQNSKSVPLKLLTDRMIDKMSNTSRLVEKLNQKNLIIRSICTDNKRQVEIKITENGFKILEQMTILIDQDRLNNRKLTEEEAITLSNLLDKMRG